jgi:hypothetical protein
MLLLQICEMIWLKFPGYAVFVRVFFATTSKSLAKGTAESVGRCAWSASNGRLHKCRVYICLEIGASVKEVIIQQKVTIIGAS